jgi:hypothetical protein
MPRELKLIAPRQAVLPLYEDAPFKPDEVRGQGILNGISHGTEMNLYRGTSPFADKEFDTELRLSVPRKGSAPACDRGYESVGRFAEVGADVQNVPSQPLSVGPAETWKAEKVSIWQAGSHGNPFGMRLTTLIISKPLPDAAVPMSLLADYPNVQFNFYRHGIGITPAEMH